MTDRPDDRPRRSRRGRAAPATSLEELGHVERRREAHRARRRPAGYGVWVAAALFVLLVVGAGAFTFYLHRQSDLTAASPPGPSARALVVILGGVGARDVNAHTMPNVWQLASQGTSFSNAWIGQIENNTVASQATIGTGLFPRRNGVPGRVWANTGTGRVESPTSNAQVQLGTLDALMQARAGDSLATRVKSRYPNDAIVSVSGADCGAANAAGTWTADYILCARRQSGMWVPGSITGHAPQQSMMNPTGLSVPVVHGRTLAAATTGWTPGAENDWVTTYAIRALRMERPRLAYIDFPEIPALLRFAPPARAVRLRRYLLRRLDRDVGMVLGELRRLKESGKTIVAVTSDGALVPVASRIHPFPLDQAILKAGGQTVYFASDMTGYLALRDHLQIGPVAHALTSAGQGKMDLVLKKTGSTSYRYQLVDSRSGLPRHFVNAQLYLASTAASRASPDVILVYSPGVGTRGVRAGRFAATSGILSSQWPGMHIPLFFWGKDVLPGVKSTAPAQLTDVAPTVLSLLGMPSNGTDGIVLADALYQPSPALKARERARTRVLEPLVAALRRRVGATP